jgi:hypothetical protein
MQQMWVEFSYHRLSNQSRKSGTTLSKLTGTEPLTTGIFVPKPRL